MPRRWLRRGWAGILWGLPLLAAAIPLEPVRDPLTDPTRQERTSVSFPFEEGAWDPLHPEPDTGRTGMVDRIQQRISGFVLGGMDRTDRAINGAFVPETERHLNDLGRFFGDRGAPRNRTRIRITPYVVMTETDTKISSRFRGHFDLPRLEDRVQLVFDNMADDSDLLGEYRDFSSRDPARPTDNPERVALRWRFLNDVRFDSDLAGGLRFTPEPEPQVKLRGRMKWANPYWRVNLGETLFWDHDDQFGEITELQASRRLGVRYGLSLRQSALYSEVSQGVELGSSAGLTRRLSRRRVVTLTGAVGWHTHPNAVVNEYIVRMPYRQLVYRDWVFVEIEPGLDFHNDNDWDAEPRLTLRLEMQFGGRR